MQNFDTAAPISAVLDIPAGRVQPDAYSEFQGFAQRSDDALLREITIETP